MKNMTQVAVVGGTGVVGRHVVRALAEAGHVATVIARSVGVDVLTGEGLTEALAPASVVIDVSNQAAGSKRKAVRLFDQATSNLLAAEREVGVGHHVALSIVGSDHVDLGYYLGKRRQEELVLSGDTPWTILRATQFHEFPAQLAARIPGPVVPVPVMTTRPVAAHEVAQALVELALKQPSGQVTEMGGPEVHQMTGMARIVLRARGSHRVVLPVRLPGRVGRAMAGDGLLPTRPARLGTQTFAEWLREDSTAARLGTGRMMST
jgi:uncharacterized protein YbjT (DUF2867 family)